MKLFLLLLFIAQLTFAEGTIISGKLLGYDNKPMKSANVSVRTITYTKAFLTTQTDSKGNFNLTLSRKGFFYLVFSGVDHAPIELPILNDNYKTINVTIKLKHNEYDNDFSDLAVIGDFNNFSFSEPIDMLMKKNGIYSVEIDYSGDSLRYQILGLVEGRSVNGIESIGFEFDGESDYRSIILTKNKKVKISVNPKKLVNKKSEEKIDLDNNLKYENEIFKRHTIDQRLIADYTKSFSTFVSKGNFPDDFIYNWAPYKLELEQLISSSESKRVKDFLILIYTNLLQYNVDGIDTSLFKYIIKEIPLDSYLWSHKTYVLTKALSYFNQEERLELAEKILQSNTDENTRLAVLVNEFFYYRAEHNEPLEKLFYEKVINEFSATPLAEMLQKQFNPDREIKYGKELPSFKFESLYDSTKFFTNDNFRGTVFLIDFWAEWCKPCLAERKYLTEAYEKFQNKGLKILSISFDKKRENAIKYLENSLQNNWDNGYKEDAFKTDVIKDFEIVVIPKPILVDAAGKILATEEQLRGKELLKTLTKYLGE